MFMCDGWKQRSSPARGMTMCREERKKKDVMKKTAGKEVRFICMQSATGTYIYKPSLTQKPEARGGGRSAASRAAPERRPVG